jgi:hypothetical protein
MAWLVSSVIDVRWGHELESQARIGKAVYSGS